VTVEFTPSCQSLKDGSLMPDAVIGDSREWQLEKAQDFSFRRHRLHGEFPVSPWPAQEYRKHRCDFASDLLN